MEPFSSVCGDMGRPLRWVEPNTLHEITIRCFQRRSLLKPSRRVRELVLGVLGRAQRHTAMLIHEFVFLSNHAHLYVSPRDAKQLAEFVRPGEGWLAGCLAAFFRRSAWQTWVAPWFGTEFSSAVFQHKMLNLGTIIPIMGMSRSSREFSPPTGVADALFATTKKRLLALLFGHPERSYYATELISKTGSGSGAVQRELQRLVASGLLVVTQIGNQKHYRANADSPVYEELRSLVTKTVGLADPIREALTPLAAKIELAVLYGSLAKGSASSTSDIDLLVVSSAVHLEDLYAALGDTEERLGREIQVTLYTSEEFARRKAEENEFVRRLLAGPHIVLLGKGDAESAAG